MYIYHGETLSTGKGDVKSIEVEDERERLGPE